MLKKILVLICFLLVLAVAAGAANWIPPDLTWETIQTPHFKIHYPIEFKSQAMSLVPMVEQVHDRLSVFFKHEVDVRVNIILLDISDYGNGWASVVGDPAIVLYMVPFASNATPSRYEQWLKYVFIHEYTHILTLDYVPQELEGAKWLTGRITFPNLLMPRYLVEGLTVYSESYFDRGGRATDPRWQAMLRMDALENNFRAADQVAQVIPDWPGGNLMYLYGGEFLEYVANTYGIDKYIELEQQYPFYVLGGPGLQGDFKGVLGKNFSELWTEWQTNAKDKYQQLKLKVESAGIKEGQKVSSRGYQSFKPKWAGDSATIYYLSNTAHRFPELRRLNVDSKDDQSVCDAMVDAENFCFDSSFENLLLSKAGYCDTLSLYKDLFVYRLRDSKWMRLTYKERATDPSLSADNKLICYVKQEGEKRNLNFLKVKEDQSLETEGLTLEGQFFSPTWFPDGNKLIVSSKGNDGNYSICTVTYPTLEIKALFSVPSSWEVANANPTLSPDGKLILFDSDVSGIVNIYAYSLASGKIYQVTNTLGGAMMPAISPDSQKLAYVSYSSKGYDISVMPFTPEKWELAGFRPLYQEKVTREALPIDYGKRVNDVKVSTYSAWPAVMPKFWIPAFYLSNYGVYTYLYTEGWDPLMWNRFQLAFSYDSWAGRPAYAIGYTNNQFWPEFSLYMTDASTPYYSTNDSLTWRREVNQGLYATFYQRPLLREDDIQALSFGFEQQLGQELSNTKSYPVNTDWKTLRGPVFTWSYAGARQYAYSISKEDGLDLNLTAKAFSPKYGSQYDFYQQLLSVDWYFPIPRFFHQVLALRFNGFTSSGQDLDSGQLYGRTMGVRGYSLGVVSGYKGKMSSVEYRFPIWYIKRGTIDGAMFYNNIAGKVFYEDAGATWQFNGTLSCQRSIGAEVTLDMVMANYFYPVLTLGYAEGWDPGGLRQMYFSISF